MGLRSGETFKGGAVVLRVEDPARVEELRRQLGLIPLAEYVKCWSFRGAIQLGAERIAGELPKAGTVRYPAR